MDHRSDRRSKALINACVAGKLFKISAYHIAWREVCVARKAGLGQRQETLYNASKAAVRSFARNWTNDLKQQGIRVNVVSPGGTETRLIRSYLDAQPAVEEALNKSVPLGRLAEPNEVARAVLFLASSDSSFVAGHELFVDGGIAAV
jgi:NAD(P)-dependent dehydrogenase (short-subunit alcohol dehydrogenase family)